MLPVPEVDSDGDVVRAHKGESIGTVFTGEPLYAFSSLLVRLFSFWRRIPKRADHSKDG